MISKHWGSICPFQQKQGLRESSLPKVPGSTWQRLDLSSHSVPKLRHVTSSTLFLLTGHVRVLVQELQLFVTVKYFWTQSSHCDISLIVVKLKELDFSYDPNICITNTKGHSTFAAVELAALHEACPGHAQVPDTARGILSLCHTELPASPLTSQKLRNHSAETARMR